MFNYHIVIQCFTFDWIQQYFPYILDRTQNMHKFLLETKYALSIATFISKAFEHGESLLTLTCITRKCLYFLSHRSYLTFEDNDKLIYLSIATSSYKPNPCTRLFHSHKVYSWLRYLLEKFPKIESHYSLLDVLRENIIFLVLLFIFDLCLR